MAEEPTEEKLVAEAERFALPAEAYLTMTPKERRMAKMSASRSLRKEARRYGIDEERYLDMSGEERTRAREAAVEALAKKRTEDARRRSAGANDVNSGEEEDEDEQPDVGADDDDDDVDEEELYAETGEVPAEEPAKRARGSIGEVRTLYPDLVGWDARQPKNLPDVWSLFSGFGDGNFRIRVERTQPSHYQKMPTRGFVGWIESPIDDMEFYQRFGGSEYNLTVYGPDPKGRRDRVTGAPIEKALTEPFRYYVPIFPPNLRALPRPKDKTMNQGWDPFGMPGAGTPTTEADAKIHTANVGLFEKLIKGEREELQELRQRLFQGGTAMSDTALKEISQAHRTAAETAQREAGAREQMLMRQLEDARSETKRLAEQIEQIRTKDQDGGVVGKAFDTLGKIRGGETMESYWKQRVEDDRVQHHKEIEELKGRHKDEIDRLEKHHAAELKRNDERWEDRLESLKRTAEEDVKRQKNIADDAERKRREDLEREEKRAKEREQQIQDEARKSVEEEKRRADERIRELKERYEDRLKDFERNAKDLRDMIENNFSTRLDVQKHGYEQELRLLKEKAQSLEEDLGEAREEAKNAGDPAQIVEKFKEQAAALGMQEAEGPKTATERFATMAGTGFGRFLENLPKMVEDITQTRREAIQAQTRGQLPPGPRTARQAAAAGVPPPHAAQPPRPRAPRTVSWATADGISMGGAPPMAPETPLGMQDEPAAPPQPRQGAPTNGSQPQQRPLADQPNPLGPLGPFSPEAADGFRREIEQAINYGIEPGDFADAFTSAYSDASKMLTEMYQARDIVAYVSHLPDGEASPIMRADGQAWLGRMLGAVRKIHRERAREQQRTAGAPPPAPAAPPVSEQETPEEEAPEEEPAQPAKS